MNLQDTVRAEVTSRLAMVTAASEGWETVFDVAEGEVLRMCLGPFSRFVDRSALKDGARSFRSLSSANINSARIIPSSGDTSSVEKKLD